MTTKPGGHEEKRYFLIGMGVSTLCGVSEVPACGNWSIGWRPWTTSRLFYRVLFHAVEWFFFKPRRLWNTRTKGLLSIAYGISNSWGLHQPCNKVSKKCKIWRVFIAPILIESNVVSQNNGRAWSVTELEELRRGVCALKQKVLKTFSTGCTVKLFLLKFHPLDHLLDAS